MKTEIVCDLEEWDADWPPENVLEALTWLADKIATIPSEYRASAKVVFSGYDNYGSSCGRVKISYERYPTPTEIAADLAAEAAKKAKIEAGEREMYESLKARFGSAAE